MSYGSYEEGDDSVDSATLTAGIDLGTQSVRVVLADGEGTVVAESSAPLSSTRYAGVRHEQDAEVWWRAVGEAARRATSGIGGEVSAISICSTSGTILLANEIGAPSTPALMYDDGRAVEEADLVQRSGQELWTRLGYQMQRSFALPKLLWLLRAGYGTGAQRLMHSADFVATRLAGGPVATDWSHALKTGYDLLEECWPGEVLEEIGVREEMLPEVVRPGAAIGEVCAEAARHTGFAQGTIIRAGMTDGCAAQIAAGAFEEGHWNSVLGTTLAVKGVTRELLRDPSGAVYCHRHPDGGWLPGGASSTGAGMISEQFPERDLYDLDRQAKSRGASRAVIYPLTSKGERFPFAAPEALGFEIGTPRDEVERYRAILEGVAFVERLGFSYLKSLGAEIMRPVTFTGGAARSRFWSQLRSDVLGMQVRVPENSEPGFGMATLARAGDMPVAPVAARLSRTAQLFEPDERRSAALSENYEKLAEALVERDYIAACILNEIP
jgi:sugar (pentulose or hexulose) kinase